MTKDSPPPIPVNVIAGPLGVGKTTTINALLAQRPPNERWAVLVNEYGLVGLDAAFMDNEEVSDTAPGVEIREVAGGCICCTAGVMFEMSLVLLLRRRPDRLLIEPTGLATLSGVLDKLDLPGIRRSVDVRSVICLMDPGRLETLLKRPEVRDQVEAADVLLASRSDLASQEQCLAFDEWAGRLFPAKSLVSRVNHGKISVDLLDLISRQKVVFRPLTPLHGGGQQVPSVQGSNHHDQEKAKSFVEGGGQEVCDESNPIVQRSHQGSIASTVGWILWAGLTFDSARIAAWLGQLATQSGALRTKAVLHTNKGWKAYNFTDGTEEVRASGHRRDSRIEVIIDGTTLPDTQALELELRSCLLKPAVY